MKKRTTELFVKAYVCSFFTRRTVFIFRNNHIITIPTYNKTEAHKHALLHILVSEEPITVESGDLELKGKLIFIGQDVSHKVTLQTLNTLLFFIDPSTAIADGINIKYLRGQPLAIFHPNYQLSVSDKSEAEVIEISEQILSDLGIYIEESKIMDARIKKIMNKMDEREFLLKTVEELAEEVCLSPSRLSHLFKQETSMRLKNCLLIHKLKMVYLDVSSGKSLTRAAMDLGFTDSAHLSTVAKRLTGISISTYFLKR